MTRLVDRLGGREWWAEGWLRFGSDAAVTCNAQSQGKGNFLQKQAVDVCGQNGGGGGVHGCRNQGTHRTVTVPPFRFSPLTLMSIQLEAPCIMTGYESNILAGIGSAKGIFLFSQCGVKSEQG